MAWLPRDGLVGRVERMMPGVGSRAVEVRSDRTMSGEVVATFA
jgi:hypothetical protein